MSSSLATDSATPYRLEYDSTSGFFGRSRDCSHLRASSSRPLPFSFFFACLLRFGTLPVPMSTISLMGRASSAGPSRLLLCGLSRNDAAPQWIKPRNTRNTRKFDAVSNLRHPSPIGERSIADLSYQLRPFFSCVSCISWFHSSFHGESIRLRSLWGRDFPLHSDTLANWKI